MAAEQITRKCSSVKSLFTMLEDAAGQELRQGLAETAHFCSTRSGSQREDLRAGGCEPSEGWLIPMSEDWGWPSVWGPSSSCPGLFK